MKNYVFTALFYLLLLVASTAAVFADDALLLNTPALAARVRFDLIAAAKPGEEIFLSTYLFREDDVGLEFISALIDASKRGVRVTLLLDSLHNGLSREVMKYMQNYGVHLYNFNPLKLGSRLKFKNRMHDKIFQVGNELIVGDRNMGNEYFGLHPKSRVGKDIYVKGGESPQKAANYIRTLILSGDVIPKYIVPEDQAEGFAAKVIRVSKKIKQARENLQLHMQILDAEKDWRSRVKPVTSTNFYYDPIYTKGITPGVESEILAGINRAKSHLVIESPYIVLTDEFKAALRSASVRGVKIEVITNSRYSNDWKVMSAAWEESKSFFTEIGASIYEHPGLPEGVKLPKVKLKDRILNITRSETMMHAKTIVIDGKETFNGSYNIDPISQKNNREVIQHTVDEAYAQNLLAIYEQEKKDLHYIQSIDHGRELTHIPECNFLWKSLATGLKSRI